MPKKPPRRLPPRKEVDQKTELEAIWKTLKALRKGLNRVNGLLVAHAQGSDDDVARHARRRFQKGTIPWCQRSRRGAHILRRG
uniref:Uncharacterized protein n=1 Tax=Solanum tuberosum TaxID=4113 RepID=M1AGE1_SOLTU